MATPRDVCGIHVERIRINDASYLSSFSYLLVLTTNIRCKTFQHIIFLNNIY